MRRAIILMMVAGCWRGPASSGEPAAPIVARPARVEDDPLAALQRDVRAIAAKVVAVSERLNGPITDDERVAALAELRALDDVIIRLDQKIESARGDGEAPDPLAELAKILVAARVSIVNAMLEDVQRQIARLKALQSP